MRRQAKGLGLVFYCLELIMLLHKNIMVKNYLNYIVNITNCQGELFYMTKNYGDRLQQVRNKFKLNQTDFGAEIGMSQSHYSKIELNKVKPSKTVLYALKEHFGINPNWIMTGKGEMFISPEEYIVKGIKLLGAQKFSEGLKRVLADSEFAEVRSSIALNELVKDIVHQDLAVYLRYIIDLWQQKDDRTRTWLLVQLERTFPEVGEESKKDRH